MFKIIWLWIKKHKKWIVWLLLATSIKLFSINPHRVESLYSRNLYPGISRGLRYIFGPIGFSVGDILYIGIIICILYVFYRLLQIFLVRKAYRYGILTLGKTIVKVIIVAYILFNLLWGLNYNRVPVSNQLGLTNIPFARADLDSLLMTLIDRLKTASNTLDSTQTKTYVAGQQAFKIAINSYQEATSQGLDLNYKPASIKPTFFGKIGNLMGFMGYYNPFTGEAQVNTTVPAYLQAFVSTHEIAHQLGYAKENEANVVGFLASHHSIYIDVRYSCYMDMFSYAWSQLKHVDSTSAANYYNELPQRCKKDIKEYRAFLQKNKSVLDVITMKIYDLFLKANEQPAGTETYNHVVNFLIAYMKKNGRQAI